jgi:hypothetical protein
MINLPWYWAINPQLTVNTLMLLVAISTPCLALYAASDQILPALSPRCRATSVPARMTVTLAWSLAAAVPAFWVGKTRRTAPHDWLIRFGIGNVILASLLAARISPPLIIALVASAVAFSSLGWFIWLRMEPGAKRERFKGYLTEFLWYFGQLLFTLQWFVATLALLYAVL